VATANGMDEHEAQTIDVVLFVVVLVALQLFYK